MSTEKKVLTVLILLLLAEAVFYHSRIYFTEKNKAEVKVIEPIEEKKEEKSPEYDRVKLYLIETTSKSLIKKKESIAKSNGEKKVKLVFEKLKNISKVGFNKNAEIINVFIEGNDRVFINLSRDFIDESSSSDIKTLTLYSVVNSVCALGYSKVKFMIENEDIDKIGGDISAQEYFEKDTLLSKGE